MRLPFVCGNDLSVAPYPVNSASPEASERASPSPKPSVRPTSPQTVGSAIASPMRSASANAPSVNASESPSALPSIAIAESDTEIQWAVHPGAAVFETATQSSEIEGQVFTEKEPKVNLDRKSSEPITTLDEAGTGHQSSVTLRAKFDKHMWSILWKKKKLVRIDNEGAAWAERSSISGKYVAFTTHRGSLFLSFYPFSSAKEIGTGSSNKIELKLDGKKAVTLTSKTAFLPEDVNAKIYGAFQTGRKTKSFSRLKSWSLSDEVRFVERMNAKE